MCFVQNKKASPSAKRNIVTTYLLPPGHSSVVIGGRLNINLRIGQDYSSSFLQKSVKNMS